MSAQYRSPVLFGAMFLFTVATLASNTGQAQEACLPSCDACGPYDWFASSDPWCSAAGGERTQLTGDWSGARTSLKDNGVTVDADSTMFYMGVTGGGVDREFRFSGHNDYVINMDLGKMGVQEGLFVKLRAEHRFGESLAGATGALLPSNVVADLPVADSRDVYLTNVLITQIFSEQFGVFFGKMDTLDGDVNEFAHGRGKTQFSNIAFVASPLVLRTAPYSTLGAGFVILGEGAEPLFTFTVLNPTDTARNSGFNELFNEGVSLVGELRLPTEVFGLPGHQLFGASWSSREYVALGQDPRIILPNVPIARQDGSWSVYWNFDQYLWVDPSNSERGWGVFGRAGLADPETNPIAWFLSFGVGGHSLVPGRDNDTFGAGWYYSGTSNELAPFLATALGGVGDGQGVELYYDVEVTKWLHVTPDLQFVMPARDAVDTATIAGVRARVIF